MQLHTVVFVKIGYKHGEESREEQSRTDQVTYRALGYRQSQKSHSANRPTETLVTTVSLEEEKINMNRFWVTFSELFGNLSRKPLHRLFQLLFCLFLFKQPVV